MALAALLFRFTGTGFSAEPPCPIIAAGGSARVGVQVALSYAEPFASSRIAIIIDDLGEDPSVLKALDRVPLTLAVMPGQPCSRETALEAARQGFEVILHLPMEPLEFPRRDPGEVAVRRGMSGADVARLLDRAMADVPGARGLNNHMGSRATRDPILMTHLLTEIRARDLFFIDSRTTGRSVAFRTARELNVRAAARSVFLDVDREPAAIRRQLRELEATARKEGAAIGIGHPFPETLEALRDIAPRLAARGFRLVFASSLTE